MHLEPGFEAKLRESVLDDVEETLRRELGPALKRVVAVNWQAYAARNGYDIDFVWEDVEGPSIERDGRGVRMRFVWPELTALFEFGVSPHTIDGNPLLHFFWEEKGQWVKTESVNWGSETGGIPESRAIRDALNWFRREVSS